MLHAIVLSNIKETRVKGYNIIFALRNFKQLDISQAEKKILSVNWNANHWSSLINFDRHLAVLLIESKFKLYLDVYLYVRSTNFLNHK